MSSSNSPSRYSLRSRSIVSPGRENDLDEIERIREEEEAEDEFMEDVTLDENLDRLPAEIEALITRWEKSDSKSESDLVLATEAMKGETLLS
jgi:hypothetical protein